MFSTSVSNLDLFRAWRDDEDLDLAWLLDRLTRKVEETEQMRIGTALHKALETAPVGEFSTLAANGYTFQFCGDVELCIPPHREVRISQQYGELEVRGRVDAISGLTVEDHKTTAQFDPDRFMGSYQWRMYLDMTNSHIFRWNVFVIRETDDPKIYSVVDFHRLEQRRYPAMHEDCLRLAHDFAAFAKENVEAFA